jgi:hypothetical protein
MGWYLDWKAAEGRFQSTEVEYVPMIRLKGGEASPSGQVLLTIVDALPGALWLIGNEPDVEWQDNSTPAEYAEAYHDLYHLLKDRDPTCQVAIGGVTQPTPLRLRYLDAILSIYLERFGEPMPIDVWNVHNFILREERDAWGVGIPPGFVEDAGTLREIADHDDLAIFEEQLVAFRKWMADKGFQDKPLIVSEYGILMPGDYGFPPRKVERFMLDTFQLFTELADPDLGYPADDYRLVQRWCWYSLADDFYATGNLADPDSGQLTTLGEAFSRFALQPH